LNGLSGCWTLAKASDITCGAGVTSTVMPADSSWPTLSGENPKPTSIWPESSACRRAARSGSEITSRLPTLGARQESVLADSTAEFGVQLSSLKEPVPTGLSAKPSGPRLFHASGATM
jgi:hypothetical protein